MKGGRKACIPYLSFRFQSNFFDGVTLLDMIDAKELRPVISALQKAIGGSAAQTKEVFITIFWLHMDMQA